MYCTYHPTEQFSYYSGGKREGYTRPLALNRIASHGNNSHDGWAGEVKRGVSGG